MKDTIKEIFEGADGIVITAGAGMGVDGGIPDFRGASGLWSAEKDNFMKFANGNAFHERPLEAWNFYIMRLITYSRFEPHQGYYDLKKLIDGKDSFVVTSNVDGHFERSGYDANKIYEIHGNLKYIQCSKHCCDAIQPMPHFERELTSLDEAPHCPYCGEVSRPVVLMFDDYWFVAKTTITQALKYKNWAVDKKNLVGIELGAGTAVPSIRSFGMHNTATLIRINPHDYQISRKQDISIAETALNGIQSLLKILESKE